MPANKPSFRKFDKKTQELYFESLREGNSRFTAARASGVSYELIRQYRNLHPDWAEAERDAEREACGKVEDALFQAAQSGNVTACLAWLYSRDPERWKDQRNIKTEPMQIDVTSKGEKIASRDSLTVEDIVAATRFAELAGIRLSSDNRTQSMDTAHPPCEAAPVPSTNGRC